MIDTSLISIVNDWLADGDDDDDEQKYRHEKTDDGHPRRTGECVGWLL